jgi:predicted transcriptional regulator
MYYMKTSTLSIRLDPETDSLLSELSRKEGKSKSEVAREALRRQLRLSQFDTLRKRVMPFAESRGYLTDEDVFREVS